MVSLVEHFLTPELARIELPSFTRRQPNDKKGLTHDRLWKLKCAVVLDSEFNVPSDNRWDGELTAVDQIADTKFLMPQKSYVYLSERERLEQCRRNCVYPIYQWARDGCATELLCYFDYATAEEACAVEEFRSGKWVYCEETGRTEPPSSINLRRLLRHPGVLWFDDPR